MCQECFDELHGDCKQRQNDEFACVNCDIRSTDVLRGTGMSGNSASIHEEYCGCQRTDVPSVIADNHDETESVGTQWHSAQDDSDDLFLPLKQNEKVPVDVNMCEICSSLTVNPACVRCDIVICDVCLYHYDAQCMCTTRATVLAASSHFG